jgi:predicted RNase H-like nuclease (RuvC/YqgF family)
VITNLSRAREELERSAAVERKLTHKLDKAKTEAEALRTKLAEQAGVIQRLLAEIEAAKAPSKKKWRLGGGK